MERDEQENMIETAPPIYVPRKAPAKRQLSRTAFALLATALIVAIVCANFDVTSWRPTISVFINTTTHAPILARRTTVPIGKVAPLVLLFSTICVLLTAVTKPQIADAIRRVDHILSTAILTALFGVLSGCVDFWLLAALFQIGATTAICTIFQDILHNCGSRAEWAAYSFGVFSSLSGWVVVFDHLAHMESSRLQRGLLALQFVAFVVQLPVAPLRTWRLWQQGKVDDIRDVVGLVAKSLLAIMITVGSNQ